jgi:hypothetical protein
MTPEMLRVQELGCRYKRNICTTETRVKPIFHESNGKVPLMSVNGACMKESLRGNRREVLERVMKYWLRLLETDEASNRRRTETAKKERGKQAAEQN